MLLFAGIDTRHFATGDLHHKDGATFSEHPAIQQEKLMEKIFEFIDPGEIVSLYNHGTHVVEVMMYLDDRHTLEPHSVVLSHAEAEQRIAVLRRRQDLTF